LIKELRLRAVADRVLVLCPAPLTVQWQDELHEKFDEEFTVVDSHLARWQLGRNPWEREDRCIASLDFAKPQSSIPIASCPPRAPPSRRPCEPWLAAWLGTGHL